MAMVDDRACTLKSLTCQDCNRKQCQKAWGSQHPATVAILYLQHFQTFSKRQAASCLLLTDWRHGASSFKDCRQQLCALCSLQHSCSTHCCKTGVGRSDSWGVSAAFNFGTAGSLSTKQPSDEIISIHRTNSPDVPLSSLSGPTPAHLEPSGASADGLAGQGSAQNRGRGPGR